MTPVLEGISLVVVGNWNPAILQGDWIVREVMGGDPAGTQVQLEFSPVAGIPPRTTIGNVTFVPALNRLQMHPKFATGENLALVETYAKQILEKLVHTPVKAIGENFLFRLAEPTEPALEDFEFSTEIGEKFGFPFELQDRQIGVSLELQDGHLINMERSLLKNGSMEFKFNFHYPAATAALANDILGNTFPANFERAKNIVRAYGFTVDEGGETDA
jgi:hypothetical protein